MAVLETLPSVNLKWDDIRDTLNAGGGSVTNVVSTAFLEKNINIFSFYKPHHGIYDFPPSVPYTDTKGGLYLDEVNHVIKWNAPKGGSGSPYRLSDFCGYKYKSLPPSVDGTQLRATADMTSVSFDVTIEPTWGDAKFDWGLVCGGFTFANMQIKCEVYNQDKKLIGSSSFKVSDIKSTGRVTMTLNRNNQIDRTDTKIYVKGYFCDYDGNVLCPIPTTTDGFVEKPLTVTQSVYLYAGAVTINNTSFAAKSGCWKEKEHGCPTWSWILRTTVQATMWPVPDSRRRNGDGGLSTAAIPAPGRVVSVSMNVRTSHATLPVPGMWTRESGRHTEA